MNNFKDPNYRSYTMKTETTTCRDCGVVFEYESYFNKYGFPLTFIPKHCKECNIKITKPISSNMNTEDKQIVDALKTIAKAAGNVPLYKILNALEYDNVIDLGTHIKWSSLCNAELE